MKKRLLSLLLGFCFGTALLAQPGSVDASFVPATTEMSLIYKTTVQSDGKILAYGADEGGYDAVLLRYHGNGTRDSLFRAPLLSAYGPLSPALALQPDGKILVLASRNGLPAVVRLLTNGTVDPSFQFQSDDYDTYLAALAVTADGKILVGGRFPDGAGGYRALIRLNSDGSVDPGFVMNAISGDVMTLALQNDGRVLVGGYLTGPDGANPLGIARLLANGTLDPTFTLGTGMNEYARVWTLAVQPDGRILAGGDFTGYNGAARNRIVRLLTNGGVDPSFNPGAGADNSIINLILQPDGRIVLQGMFLSYAGQPRRSIARLNSNGSLDASFNPAVGNNGSINAIALQADGRLLAGGRFTTSNGLEHARLLRLNADGSRDLAFNPGYVSLRIELAAIQPDGKVVVVGGYDQAIYRFNSDGSFDTSFRAQVREGVRFVRPLADGKLLIAGAFFINNTKRGLLRLNADGTLDASYTPALPAESFVFSMAAYPDGRIAVFGGYEAETFLLRLLPNGTRDATFNAVLPAGVLPDLMAAQADGKLIFTGANDGSGGARYLGRLQANGNPDASFAATLPAGFSPTQLAIQSDGKPLLRGLTAGPLFRMIRLQSNGAQDTAFNRQVEPWAVYAFALQPDNRILIGARQGALFGTPLRFLRLNSNGATDNSFAEGTIESIYPTATVQSIALGTDGRIVAAGNFSRYHASVRVNLLRLIGGGGNNPTAGIHYNGSPYCRGGVVQLPVIQGASGGRFSVVPAGLTVDVATGAINLASAQPGQYTISYTYAGGCIRTQVQVLPPARVSPVPHTVVCEGARSPVISFSGTAAAYSWTNSNPGIGLAAAGSGSIPSFLAQRRGHALLRVTPQGDGRTTCTGTTVNAHLLVHPCPKDKDGAGLLQNATITLSPNPARGQVTVTLGATASTITVTLLNRSGTPVLRPVPLRGNTVTFDLSGLVPGIYIVQITDTRTGLSVQKQVVKM